MTYLVRVESDTDHGNHRENEWWGSQGISGVAVEAKRINHRREEIDDGAVDIAQIQNRHQQPCLGVLDGHDETLESSDFIRVVLLAQVLLEIPLNPFTLNLGKTDNFLVGVGQEKRENDSKTDGQNAFDQKQLKSFSK